MPTRKAPHPAVRITLANGSTVVAGRHSLAKLLELTFSSRPQPGTKSAKQGATHRATRRATQQRATPRPAKSRPAAARGQRATGPGVGTSPAATRHSRGAA